MTPGSGAVRPCDVFLCHNGKDRPEVLELAARLRVRGIEVWIDQEQMLPGDVIDDEIERVIETVPAVACCFGAHGVGPYQADEIKVSLAQARRRELRVLGVYLASCPREFEPPAFLRIRMWADLREENGFDRLCCGIAAGATAPVATRSVLSARPATDDRASISAWLQWGLDHHAQIPVIGLRWGQRPGPSGDEQRRPTPEWWAAEDVFVRLDVSGTTSDAGDSVGAVTSRIKLDKAIDWASQFGRKRGTVRMVLLGEPGAGKTTILRHLFYRLAAHGRASDATGAPPPNPPKPLGGLHPLWISMSRIMTDARAHRDFAVVVRRLARAEGYERAAQQLLDHPNPRFLVLLDGLDEIPDDDLRVDTLELVDTALSRWGTSSFVLTSRRGAWQAVVDRRADLASRFVEAQVATLDRRARAAYITAWFRAYARRRFTYQTAAVMQREATKLAKRLLTRLEERAWATESRLASMVANPLMLSVLCATYAAERPLPERPAELFDAALQVLIEGVHRTSAAPAPDEDVLMLPAADVRTVLEPLAYASQDGGGLAVRRDAAIEIVEPTLAGAPRLRELMPTALAFLQAMTHRCGILVVDDPDYVAFLHLQLREYLAARHVARHGLGAVLAGKVGEAHWREPILLAMSMTGVATAFFEAALAPDAADTLRVAIDLLRTCLEEAGARLDPAPLASAIRRAALALRRPEAGLARATARLLSMLVAGYDERLLPERAELEHLLAPASVPPVPPTTFGRPGIRMRWIPPGTFTIGSAADEPLARLVERPAHEVEITHGFWLGEHTVTNEQYEQFIRARPHAPPAQWRESRFNRPLQPVVGVSWDDAVAFCDWLNEDIHDDVEFRFRLPTEAEWEYAARGRDGRRYPWGDAPAPDDERATFGFEEVTGQPSEIGRHVDSASPFGIHDLVGNVWEWCLDRMTQYTSRRARDPGLAMWESAADNLWLKADKARHSRAGVVRVRRGGAWNSEAGKVRAAYREGWVRGSRLADGGFRVARGHLAAEW